MFLETLYICIDKVLLFDMFLKPDHGNVTPSRKERWFRISVIPLLHTVAAKTQQVDHHMYSV
jgi:hypothetical protein